MRYDPERKNPDWMPVVLTRIGVRDNLCYGCGEKMPDFAPRAE